MFDQMYVYDLPRPLPMVDRRYKPDAEIAPNCPRCDSSNTKFCYYNNYSLTQPRYYCKGCRRYWTRGGSLRNVPVGGGCRKNRRSRSSTRSGSGGGASHSGQRVASSDCVRPDIALDSIWGSSGDHGSSDTTTTTIDLAMVYSKFLNLDQSATNETGSSSCSDQMGIIGELDNYPNDQNGDFELPDIDPNAINQGGDVFWMNCEVMEDLTWQEQGCFGNLVSELGMMGHPHQDVMGGDGCAWIDKPSFGGL